MVVPLTNQRTVYGTWWDRDPDELMVHTQASVNEFISVCTFYMGSFTLARVDNVI